MTFTLLSRTMCAATLVAACAVPARADSVASSASSAGSASSGSISDSIGGSSNSSNNDKRVAQGQYRVIDVAQTPGKDGSTRMTLQAAGGGDAPAFCLDVPDRALAERRVNSGELVQVNVRTYGYEFAYADTHRPFFLALQDDWYRELSSRQVTI
jgi:hypothetical protein